MAAKLFWIISTIYVPDKSTFPNDHSMAVGKALERAVKSKQLRRMKKEGK
jgi:hypothetical protein